jgi:hypothetical protein
LIFANSHTLKSRGFVKIKKSEKKIKTVPSLLNTIERSSIAPAAENMGAAKLPSHIGSSVHTVFRQPYYTP